MDTLDLFGPEANQPVANTPAPQDMAAAGGFPPDLPTPPSVGGHDNGDDDQVQVAEATTRFMLEYAAAVVKGRAIPSLQDGQKPVQRRILFAMHRLGLSGHVKSARIVGDVIGKLHPHGDTAAYDAMVRMAQDFSFRYPLIDGQGNFGSRDGDSAAAMRYTEARLAPFSDILLSELDSGTVNWIPNYDNSSTEPAVLPARLPVMLLNGASGIAVGMATDIPSHNLREVAAACAKAVRDGSISPSEAASYVVGPDFAGGGQIVSTADEIADTYTTGRGSLRVRAKWTIEHLADGAWALVIDELPPGVSQAKIVTEVAELSDPKIKLNKKALTPEQLASKTAFSVIEAVRDESDLEKPVRLVFEPRDSGRKTIQPQALVDLLLAYTSLEVAVPVNMTMINVAGRPVQAGLSDVINEWSNFRLDTVRRRSNHRLDQVEKRMHILNGRMIAFVHIDEVIRIIRGADDPHADLCAKIGLSAEQATDVLEIRLRQLARLEGIKIQNEIDQLASEAEDLKSILGDDRLLRERVASEIERDAAKFGDDRRTTVKAERKVIIQASVPDEPVTVIVSRNGWLRARVGHNVDLSSVQFKAGDELLDVVETRTTAHLVLIGKLGRAYTVSVKDIPNGRGDGVPATSMLNLQPNDVFVSVLHGEAGTEFLVVNNAGYGLIATFNDMLSGQRAGKAFLDVREGESTLAALRVNSKSHIAGLSSTGKLLVFAVAEMKRLPKGRGVIMMALDNGETIISASMTDARKILVSGTNRGKSSSVVLAGPDVDRHMGKRARRGVKVSWAGVPLMLKEGE